VKEGTLPLGFVWSPGRLLFPSPQCFHLLEGLRLALSFAVRDRWSAPLPAFTSVRLLGYFFCHPPLPLQSEFERRARKDGCAITWFVGRDDFPARGHVLVGAEPSKPNAQC
jgi:hypothetical protein